MRSAPAVSYPVGRSSFQGHLIIGLFLLAGLAGGAWGLQLGLWDWRLGLYGALLALTTLLAGQAWWRTPSGVLRWQAEGWTWMSAQGSSTGGVTLAMDLQTVMLLSWRSDAGQAQWLWLERHTAAHDWRALRRAVVAWPRRQPPESDRADGRGPGGLAP